jgi:hypothetical protein
MLTNLFIFTLLGIFGFGDVGTTAFPLLNVPVGPRACAMGETFTGLGDDGGTLFWNPAGLGRLNSVQLSLSHHEWFAGIRDENIGLVAPLGPGCVGAAVAYSTTGDIEIWDPANSRGIVTSARSGYVTLGYGLAPVPGLNCGIAVKGLYDDLIEQTGTGVCADLGVLYRPLANVGIGLTGRNLGWGMKYGTENIPLPMAVRLGFSYENPKFRILLDANAPVDNRPDLHVGGEYLANNILSVRAGYRLGPQDWRSLSLLSGITAGLGLNLSIFSLDYAFVPYGQLGFTHRLALRTSFPASVYGRVRIKVSEFKTGVPVTAKFVLTGTQQGNSYTESDGTFVVEGVEPGWLGVTANADRYYPTTESVLVESRVTQTVRLVARRSGFGSLWGAVYDADTRKPVAARVSYSGPELDSLKVTETEGSFTLRKLKAGEYDFTITPLDSLHQPRTETVSIEPGSLTSHDFLLGLKEATVPLDSAGLVTRNSQLDNSPASFMPLIEQPDSLAPDSGTVQQQPAPVEPQPGTDR